MTTKTITYETPADGFGELATDDDRDSFCTYVELRIEETYPDYTCTASWGSALESRVRVSSDAVDAPDEYELCSWIGNELWNEWCSGASAVQLEAQRRVSATAAAEVAS